MRHRTPLILPFLFLSAFAASQERTIGSLTVTGATALRPAEILDALRLREGERVTPRTCAEAGEALDSLYREHGYYFARSDVRLDLDAADSTRAGVAVRVDEGPYLPVIRLRIEGTAALAADDLAAAFETRAGEPLRPSVLERDVRGLLHRYATAGHPLAVAGVRDVALDTAGEPGLAVTIGVDEGPPIVLTEVRIRGNSETADDVILRAARVPLDEPYNADKVADITARLNRLNIFSRVDAPQLFRTPQGDAGLLLRVAEGQTNTFDGVLGYAPSGPAGEGYVSGLVTVAMRNLFGTGRQFGVRWQRDGRLSQEVNLRYTEPWLFGTPVSLGMEFFQRQQESTYVHRVLTFRASLIATDELTVDAHAGFESTIPSSEPPVPPVDASRAILGGAGLGYDTRDNPALPTSGAMFRTDYEIGSKIVEPPAGGEVRDPVQTVSMDAEAYLMPIPRQVVAAGIHGRERLGGAIGLADYYRLGGARTLRGYRESQFLGSRIAWSALEYRLLLAERSYVFAFLDAGYYFVPPDDARGIASSQALKEGFGIGVRTDTPLGSLGISVALAGGDPVSQAKLHVGLINDF